MEIIRFSYSPCSFGKFEILAIKGSSQVAILVVQNEEIARLTVAGFNETISALNELGTPLEKIT